MTLTTEHWVSVICILLVFRVMLSIEADWQCRRRMKKQRDIYNRANAPERMAISNEICNRMVEHWLVEHPRDSSYIFDA